MEAAELSDDIAGLCEGYDYAIIRAVIFLVR
jgi:hypothetical protein